MITSNLYNHLTLVLEGSCQWRLRKKKKEAVIVNGEKKSPGGKTFIQE